MDGLRKLQTLPRAERLLLLEALWYLGLVRLALTLLPFRTVRRLVDWGTRHRGRHAPDVPVDRIGAAVTRMSACVPGATCLVQGLAARLLFARWGLAADLHIGVSRSETGEFAAHAWVTHGGRPVVGAAGVQRFTPLVVLAGESRESAGGRPGPPVG